MADDLAVWTEAAEGYVDFLVPGFIEEDSQHSGKDLSEYGGRRGSGNAHFGEAEQAEDHDRVENNIDDGAQALGVHGVNGFSSRL